jgi:hypothetical protein
MIRTSWSSLKSAGVAVSGIAAVGVAVAFADVRTTAEPEATAKQSRARFVRTETWTLRGAEEEGAPVGRFDKVTAPIAADAESIATPADRLKAAFGLFGFDAWDSLASASAPSTLDVGRAALASITTGHAAGGPAGGIAGQGEIARGKPMPGLPIPKPRQAMPATAQKPVQVASLGGGAEVLAPRPGDAAAAAPIGADAPRKMPAGAGPYLEIIKKEAREQGVPLWVVLGVTWVESKFNPNLRGTHTVLGMMQVMPSTARAMGYRGTTADLLKPEVNVKWGVKELAQDLRLANGHLCLAIAKYKGGFLTKTINSGAQRYCDQVKMVTGMEGVTTVAIGAIRPDPKIASR